MFSYYVRWCNYICSLFCPLVILHDMINHWVQLQWLLHKNWCKWRISIWGTFTLCNPITDGPVLHQSIALSNIFYCLYIYCLLVHIIEQTVTRNILDLYGIIIVHMPTVVSVWVWAINLQSFPNISIFVAICQ